jgi:hypothetical protein
MLGNRWQLYGTNKLGPASGGNGAVFKLSPQTPLNFSQWEAKYSVSNEAYSDTPYGDSTPNLLKYFCDIVPNSPMTATSRAALPTGSQTVPRASQASSLTLTYIQAGYVTGVTPNIQTSYDLQSWTTLTSPSPVITISTDSFTRDSIMQVQVPATNNPQFIRLQLPPP